MMNKTSIINVNLADINIDNSYKIIIENGSMNKISQYVNNLAKYDTIAIITDENVNKIYSDIIKAQFQNSVALVLPAGETTKSLDYAKKCYEFLSENNITRADCIIALGGGVIGDLAGFVASTFLRGVDFIQVPTSLLAQIDSSIGGKVAVNLDCGKNLVGSFYHPKCVIIDPFTLKTLPKRELSAGFGEVIKYGALFSKDMLDNLTEMSINEIIYNCCNFKRDIVESDPFDKGKRMLLNFGHTYGHCVESYFEYKTYNHGEGVAVGMVKFALLGEKLGVTEKGTAEYLKNILSKFDLETNVNLPTDYVNKTVAKDKKSDGKNIDIILLRQLGNPLIYKIDKSKIGESLEVQTEI